MNYTSDYNGGWVSYMANNGDNNTRFNNISYMERIHGEMDIWQRDSIKERLQRYYTFICSFIEKNKDNDMLPRVTQFKEFLEMRIIEES
jgi:hypothetical protein